MIAVTGAGGYVGGIIAATMGEEVLRLRRRQSVSSDPAWSFDTPATSLTETLRVHGVTHVVHAAWDMKTSRLKALERGCVAESLQLLDASVASGAKFIFISSISAFSGARSAYGKAKLQVEKAVLDSGGVVLRLGLVIGQGGMFGNIRQTVAKTRFLPLIGGGKTPQFLLPEAELVNGVRMAVKGAFDAECRPVTLANPVPVPFKEIVQRLAKESGRKVMLVPVPWQFCYASLLIAEALGLKLLVRSDSIISFIYQDPSPDFSVQERLEIKVYDGWKKPSSPQCLLRASLEKPQI
jgi:nucleoside-diphosphate-sugar epimerase